MVDVKKQPRSSMLGVIIAGIFLSIPLLFVLNFLLDRRLGDIEEKLTFVPPPQHAPIDLSQREVESVPEGEGDVQIQMYVPAYSHVYYEGGRPLLLETTLCLRNTDPKRPCYIDSVTYHNTAGKLVKTFVKKTIRVEPLETLEFLVEQKDSQGGVGANFMVTWRMAAGTSEPMSEAIMVGMIGSRGISFARSGQLVSP